MNYSPKKQLGQNFLIDKSVIENIVIKGGVKKNDVILEIGPGQGSLTYALAKVAKKVIAVEKDKALYEYLLKKFENIKNIEFVNEDILKFLESGVKNHELRSGQYKVVGNIPYYLTSHLIRKLLEPESKPSEIMLMIQKEVADRIVSEAGEMNVLAISVQLFSEPEILFRVSRNSFWPKPKVDSAVVKMKVKSKGPGINEDLFFKLVKVGFVTKRKLLVNNLVKGLGVSKEIIYDIFKRAGIDLNSRAQDLSVGDWLTLYKNIKF